MKLAVVTRADQGIQEMSDVTHPIIKQFADRWKADFLILDKPAPVHQGHYRILEFRTLLDTYERILSLDTDTLIMPRCPNPFERVVPEKIGTVYEDQGSRRGKRRQVIKQIQERFGNIGWEQDYINTGVFLCSREHADIFQGIGEDKELWNGWGFDDAHLGYQIKKRKIQVHDFHWKWNCMSMFCEKWNGSPSRFSAFIIHYAGVGRFDEKAKSRLDQIKRDKKSIYG